MPRSLFCASLAFAMVALCVGCDDLKVESTEFECETDDDCLSGFSCQSSSNDPGVNVCVAQDVGGGSDVTEGLVGTDTGCPTACTYPRGAGECFNGACLLTTCDSGFANCDGDPSNGCEANILTNSAHCNRCNSACTGNSSCVGGVCSTEPPKSCTDFFNHACETGQHCVPVSDTAYQCTDYGTVGLSQNCTTPTECIRGALCVSGKCAAINCTPGSGSRRCNDGDFCLAAHAQADVGTCVEDPLGKDCNIIQQECLTIPNNECIGFTGSSPDVVCTRRCENRTCPDDFACGVFNDGQGGQASICIPQKACMGTVICAIQACPDFDASCILSSGCTAHMDNQAGGLFNTLSSCYLSNGCNELQCVLDRCNPEYTACFEDYVAE